MAGDVVTQWPLNCTTLQRQFLTDRSVVRIVVMRGTIHLVTVDDCLGVDHRTVEISAGPH